MGIPWSMRKRRSCNVKQSGAWRRPEECTPAAHSSTRSRSKHGRSGTSKMMAISSNGHPMTLKHPGCATSSEDRGLGPEQAKSIGKPMRQIRKHVAGPAQVFRLTRPSHIQEHFGSNNWNDGGAEVGGSSTQCGLELLGQWRLLVPFRLETPVDQPYKAIREAGHVLVQSRRRLAP